MENGHTRQRILLSTSNPGKVLELEGILQTARYELCTKAEVGLDDLEVEETGETLEDNAVLKAKALRQAWDARHPGNTDWVLADDTGLFVDALNGAPGVHTARYAGETATAAENVKKLLYALRDVPTGKRTEHFRTCIALMRGSEVTLATGQLNGRILTERRGTHGFGYDPVFMPEGEDRAFGEMRAEEKNAISHRARALQHLARILRAEA